jgi:hypothetical protein
MSFKTTGELLDHLLGDGDLSAEDIDQVRQGLDEDLMLDYKSGDLISSSNKKEASKYIREYASAFSNSEGGVLLLGVRDEEPHEVDGCSQIGAKTLAEWVGSVLISAAHLLVPPPRIKEINHPQGLVLAVAFARTANLVPLQEGREWSYYLRFGASNCEVPEYLLSDLLLGRRQRPEFRLDVKIVDALARNSVAKRIDLTLENSGLSIAKIVQAGCVFWTHRASSGRTPDSLRRYIDVVVPKSADWTLSHSLGGYGGSATPYAALPPFNRLILRANGLALTDEVASLKIAVYCLGDGIPPQWWEVSVNPSRGKDPMVVPSIRPVVSVDFTGG